MVLSFTLCRTHTVLLAWACNPSWLAARSTRCVLTNHEGQWLLAGDKALEAHFKGGVEHSHRAATREAARPRAM